MSGIAQMSPYNQMNQNVMQSFNNWYQNQTFHHHSQMYDPYNNNYPPKTELDQTPYQYDNKEPRYHEKDTKYFDKNDRTSSANYFSQNAMNYSQFHVKSEHNQVDYRENVLKKEPFDKTFDRTKEEINSVNSHFDDDKLLTKGTGFGMNDMAKTNDIFRGRINESSGVLSPDQQDSCSVSSQQDQEGEETGTIYPWMKSSLGKIRIYT